MTRPPKRRPEKKKRDRAGARPPGRALRGLPLIIAGIAVLAVGTTSGGVYAAMTAAESGSERPDGDGGGGRTVVPPSAARGKPVTVADGGDVAPLRRVVPPDVLAVGTATIPQAKIKRLAKLKRVGEVTAVAGGAIQLQNRAVNALAVDPSAFRSWTPPGTAKNTALWAALAADEFVTTPDVAEELRLARGTRYPVVGRTMPNLVMGGSGELGLPGVNMLVSEKAGADMGLVPNVAVLVNAPGVDPATTVKAVKQILGGGVEVVNLHASQHRAPGSGRATDYLDLYKRAATTCPGLSWTVLAAIGQVESSHGRNVGPSSAGALGPMQFMPATWKAYGVDGDGDGKADIMNPYDAIPGAAKYLCANGAGQGGQQLYRAVWHYNHADWYVQKVLNLAKAYADAYS
ncbi:lytic transglycosylase domain-containing protein [Actinomadura sp. WAC 06369]|uniref:lytic transglycosylase domain-containing protein n=1 Tax=Actinomadura sp. WAC 06369 TaxID=2203193 RepID=UPI0018F39A10|nr:lytic transglycosylase domain-containing protein [Actinomadura sp. WAC 06369]